MLSLFSLGRIHLRVLVTISIFVVIVSISIAATRQHAANFLFRDASNLPAKPASRSEGGLSPAATITVNSLLDTANGTDGLCTLREAITAANNDLASGAVAGECVAGSSSGTDTIDMTGVTGTIDLTSALPIIFTNLSINGPGSAQLTVRRSTPAFYRIFHISAATSSISGVTVRDGRAPDTNLNQENEGGGIRNLANLTLTDAIITANQSGGSSVTVSGGDGGGVSNRGGSLTMTNCSVTGNSTGDSPIGGGHGGGVFNTGTLTMTNCVVSGNTTNHGGSAHPDGNGGGIYNVNSMTLTNITVSNNTAGFDAEGGGIFSTLSGTLTNCTVSGNQAPRGGGIRAGAMTIVGSTINNNTGVSGAGIQSNNVISIHNSTIDGNTGTGVYVNNNSIQMVNCTATANTGNGVFGAAVVRNTIIAGNGLGTAGPDEQGGLISQGHNFVGKSSSGSFTNGVNGDQVGTLSSPIDPRLGPLANNGGTNQTRALLSGSTAIDAGDDCVTQVAHCGDPNTIQLTTDQRGAGFLRSMDGLDADTTPTVDIGAFEVQVFVEDIADKTTNEDTQLQFTFNVLGGAAITSVTATSSNTTLVPNNAANLAITGTGSTRTLTINPAADQFGTLGINVTVNGAGGESMTDEFTLTISGVNDAPSFTKGANQAVPEDAGMQPVLNWATNISPGPNESGQTISFIVTNDNNALFLAQPSVDSTGRLDYQPAPDANGSATVSVTIKDNGGTANGGIDTSAVQTFTINVTPVNDRPSFTKGANQTVLEDAGAQTVNGWATAISRGPTDESGQTLNFNVTGNTNAALFSAGPAISSTGALTYTPAANANGSATITINLQDNGGTTNGGLDTSLSQFFTITVTAVNDAPSFTKGANQTVNEDAGPQGVDGWATAISAGPSDEAGQLVSFTVTNDNNALFVVQPAVSPTGRMTYELAANMNGSATVSVVLKDGGGTANGGVDTSAAQTFTITVNPVNDPPSFTKGANQAVDNTAGPQSVANWATNILAGPANESGQTLTFQVTGNTNAGLFSAGPAVSANGTLTYTPAANANASGTATITINLKDDAGTANGGVDTSPSQSFTITIIGGGTFNFSASTYNTTESSGFTTVTVKRTGDLSRAATVDYATSENNGLPCSTANGVATPKCDFTTALGTLSFAVGEDTKVVNILISQDGFVEGPETFTVSLSNPTNNSALGTTSTSTTTIADDVSEPAPPVNVIDDARNFVRQHYHDFLSREPDQSGWDFWTNQITSCGSDVQCNEVRRIDVSASFFLSIEFQNNGYLVERFYKVAYGDAIGNSTFVSNHTLNVPIVRFNEFMTDTQRIGKGVIVLAPGWEQALENNKQAYALEFVQTTRFTTALPTTMTPTQFVTRLNQNAGGVLSLSEQQTAINLFGGAGNTANNTARAQAMRVVAEDQDLYNAEYNRAFVLAEYFGYLRRDPNATPDMDYTGYDFWLTKLNQFNGNYINAEMVKAFLSSIEYRQRFGQ